MGPSPSAGMEVATGSFRPRSLASLEIREPIRPPPITIVSEVAESLVCMDEHDAALVDGRDGEKASAVVWRLVIARMALATAAEILMVGCLLLLLDLCSRLGFWMSLVVT